MLNLIASARTRIGVAIVGRGKSMGLRAVPPKPFAPQASAFDGTLQQQQQQQQREYHASAPHPQGLRPRQDFVFGTNTAGRGHGILSTTTHTIPKRWHGGPHVDHDHADSVHVNFVDAQGNTVKEDVDAYVGESLLQVAQRNDIELEGACEGVCACSTCHIIIPDEDTFDNVLEEASEDEEDMLDMAFGLTETSRLGCQVIVTDEMDGINIEIPPATRNFYVDGHVPQPH